MSARVPPHRPPATTVYMGHALQRPASRSLDPDPSIRLGNQV